MNEIRESYREEFAEAFSGASLGGDVENGGRQFVIADPDGYLLRFYTGLGQRPAQR